MYPLAISNIGKTVSMLAFFFFIFPVCKIIDFLLISECDQLVFCFVFIFFKHFMISWPVRASSLTFLT